MQFFFELGKDGQSAGVENPCFEDAGQDQEQAACFSSPGKVAAD